MTRYQDRVARLRSILGELDSVVVAFSGGVDSAVLAHAAYAVLGTRAVAVLADSASLARVELAAARATAATIGVRFVTLLTDELERQEYRRNSGDRCYWCKRTLFEELEAWASREGIGALAYGENADDLADVRAGRRAAAELRVLAPLSAAGLTKKDVRRYARDARLPVWDKPAAACLASRIAVGLEVTRERLTRVESAEARVRALGFRVLRVRDLGVSARIEVGADELVHARGVEPRLRGLIAELGWDEVELSEYRRGGGVEVSAASS